MAGAFYKTYQNFFQKIFLLDRKKHSITESISWLKGLFLSKEVKTTHTIAKLRNRFYSNAVKQK